MPARLALVAAFAIACHSAAAQTQSVPPAVNVQRIAPQLVSFAGSEANFQSLVNGLSSGTQVQLFSVLGTGFVQNVTFTPTAALTPVQIAQLLETARQQLIGLGIGSPTAEQIAFALMGGTVPTALGGTQVPGLVNAQTAQNPPSPAAQIQAQQAGAGASTATAAPAAATPGVTSSVNVQTAPATSGTTTSTTASAPRNTSDSLIAPGATSRSPAPLTSASPLVVTPLPAPGAGSTPPAATERVPAGMRPALN